MTIEQYIKDCYPTILDESSSISEVVIKNKYPDVWDEFKLVEKEYKILHKSIDEKEKVMFNEPLKCVYRGFSDIVGICKINDELKLIFDVNGPDKVQEYYMYRRMFQTPQISLYLTRVINAKK